MNLDGRAPVSILSAGAIKETTNGDASSHEAYAYSGLSEIFAPVTSAYPETTQAGVNPMPSIHGIPIGGAVAFNVAALPANIQSTKVDVDIAPIGSEVIAEI